MSFRFPCETCGRQLQGSANSAGETVLCPACGTLQPIPGRPVAEAITSNRPTTPPEVTEARLFAGVPLLDAVPAGHRPMPADWQNVQVGVRFLGMSAIGVILMGLCPILAVASVWLEPLLWPTSRMRAADLVSPEVVSQLLLTVPLLVPLSVLSWGLGLIGAISCRSAPDGEPPVRAVTVTAVVLWMLSVGIPSPLPVLVSLLAIQRMCLALGLNWRAGTAETARMLVLISSGLALVCIPVAQHEHLLVMVPLFWGALFIVNGLVVTRLTFGMDSDLQQLLTARGVTPSQTPPPTNGRSTNA